MAAGKTTLGSALAARICCRFIDLDKEIEKQSQCSISELFARAGEPAFRKIEQQVLFHIVNQLPSAKPDTQSTDVHNNQDTDVLHNQNTDVLPNNTIIACGGGTPCSEENLAFMKAHGFVIYLEVSPETLCERLLCTPVEARPLLSLRNPITSQNPATSQDPITFQDPAAFQDPITSQDPSTFQDPITFQDPAALLQHIRILLDQRKPFYEAAHWKC